MTVLGNVLDRLSQIGCRPILECGELHVRGPVEELPDDLVTDLRRAKPALIVDMLRQKALELTAFLDGEAPYSDRLARLPDYRDTLERLSSAQEKLFESWRRTGFLVVWNQVVEEFLLIGNGESPPGSENTAVYTWEEAKALEDADPEVVRQAHRAKRAFGGRIEVSRERKRA